MPRLNLLLLSLLLGISVVVSKGFGHSLIPVSHCRQFGLPAKTFEVQSPITTTRGGSALSTTSKTMLFAADPNASKCPVSKSMATFGALWGSWGVVYILVKAVKRVLPIALEPWKGTLTLSPFQWGCYALSCLVFAYAEGYKGFHCKFSPLVVKRSLTLVIGTPQGNSVLNFVLAPLYSMALMHATRKRLVTSWSVTLGVATLVAIVKRLPPVWRCIMDAGVVVGLSIGSLSIMWLFLQAWRTGQAPAVDACLPMVEEAKSKQK